MKQVNAFLSLPRTINQQHQCVAATDKECLRYSNNRLQTIVYAESSPSAPPARPGGGGGGGQRPFRPSPGSRPPFRPGGGGGGRGRGPPRQEEDPDRPPMNDAVLRMAPNQVRVVISNAEGGDDMAGVMATKEALEKAREMGK